MQLPFLGRNSKTIKNRNSFAPTSGLISHGRLSARMPVLSCTDCNALRWQPHLEHIAVQQT